jgi:hypothetical protein
MPTNSPDYQEYLLCCSFEGVAPRQSDEFITEFGSILDEEYVTEML